VDYSRGEWRDGGAKEVRQTLERGDWGERVSMEMRKRARSFDRRCLRRLVGEGVESWAGELFVEEWT